MKKQIIIAFISLILLLITGCGKYEMYKLTKGINKDLKRLNSMSYEEIVNEENNEVELLLEGLETKADHIIKELKDPKYPINDVNGIQEWKGLKVVIPLKKFYERYLTLKLTNKPCSSRDKERDMSDDLIYRFPEKVAEARRIKDEKIQNLYFHLIRKYYNSWCESVWNAISQKEFLKRGENYEKRGCTFSAIEMYKYLTDSIINRYTSKAALKLYFIYYDAGNEKEAEKYRKIYEENKNEFKYK